MGKPGVDPDQKEINACHQEQEHGCQPGEEGHSLLCQLLLGKGANGWQEGAVASTDLET